MAAASAEGKSDPRPTGLVLEPMKIQEMKPGRYNTTNQYAYWQVDAKQTIHMARSFYEGALTSVSRQWLTSLSKNRLVLIKDPFIVLAKDIPELDTPEGQLWQSIYDRHWAQFGFEQWGPYVSEWLHHEPRILALGPYECKVLESLAQKRSMKDKSNVISDVELKTLKEDHPKLWETIETALKQHPRAFVKTGHTSGKNERTPMCVTRVEECIHTLTDNREMVKRGFQHVIIQPWYDDLKPYTEWRVFVKQGRVTVITQQRSYEVYPELTSQHVQSAGQRICEFVQSMQKVWSSLGMSTVVLDVWDFQERVSLIELNPWILSGTGTFEWCLDQDKIEGTHNNNALVYLRYLV